MSKKNSRKIDPVCGMDLTNAKDVVYLSNKGKKLFFCNDDCRTRFKRNSRKFLTNPLIKLENVWKVFKLGGVEIEVLRGLDLKIWEGDFVAIIGASGSGKSTALNMIGLLDNATSGRIFLNGSDIEMLNDFEKAKLRSQTFGFIFQQYNLIPWLTAYDNVRLPLIFSGEKIQRSKLEALFEDIGLKDRMTHRPLELSGGEQQRVALLRALVNNPSILIGDEPTGNLDSATGEKILKMLIDMNKIHKKTLIIVTHDISIAEKADQILMIKDGMLVNKHSVHNKIYTK